MKKLVIAFALSSLATGAIAQVGLGGGVVGSLGANGTASRFGGLGSGISTGTTMRGDELRQTGQLSGQLGTETRGMATPSTAGNATGSANVDTKATPKGADANVNAGGGASASAPVVSGSAWGTAEANAQATTPNAKETVRDTKNTARQKVDGLEERRDKIESRGDKAVDKTLQ